MKFSIKKGTLFMKKILTITAMVLVIALSLAGCGKKTDNAGSIAGNSTPTDQTDASGAYEETVVDMEKVDGIEVASNTDKKEYDGKLGEYSVSIGDAKIINVDDTDIVVISFDFKNNSDKETAFTSVIDVDVTQDDGKLVGAVVSNIEGVNLLAMAERIPSGDSITVQRAYKLRDNSSPVEVTIKEFGTSDDETLSKTFEF